MIVTTAELGELLGLTERHIYNLEKAGILSKEDKNAWDAAKNIQSYTIYKIDLEASSSDLGKIRARKELAEAKLKELQYKERMGLLLPLEHIARELEDIAIVVSNKLYALPQILQRKHKLSSKIYADLNAQIENTLKELKDPNIYTNLALELESKLKRESQQDLAQSNKEHSHTQGQE
ncbi:hypothetical protein LS71_002655 [Helicobacter jaachi]|uniref:DUF1441 family protein n=1 Tax=Helicobacter jaachi TaxID=1677920 RepID=A0A4U8TCI4_9HELI|nr:hypothetical protein [Helicobacter jaachi]TLD97659.1 hypothetical protein LS71_002655 [Helicobacter jaachi]